MRYIALRIDTVCILHYYIYMYIVYIVAHGEYYGDIMEIYMDML